MMETTTDVEDFGSDGNLGVEPLPGNVENDFFFTAAWKVALFSLLTVNLYLIYWFYRHWHAHQEREKANIIALARAIFSIFFVFSLFSSLHKALTDRSASPHFSPLLAALAYIALILLGNVSLDIALLYFLAFLPCLQVQAAVNRLSPEGVAISSRLSKGCLWGLALGAAALIALVVLVIFALPEDVVPGREIEEAWHQELVDAGILDLEEEIHYAYFPGLFSVLEGGSLLTDRRVLVYQMGEDEVLGMDWAEFQEIHSVESIPGESFLKESAIEVVTENSQFWVRLPLESKGVRAFDSTLRRLWNQAREESGESPEPVIPRSVEAPDSGH